MRECKAAPLFGISLFKRRFWYFPAPLKKFVHAFLSDRILYHSRLSVCLHVCEPLPICPVY